MRAVVVAATAASVVSLAGRVLRLAAAERSTPAMQRNQIGD